MLLLFLTLAQEPEAKNKLEQLYLNHRRMMKYVALKILKEDSLAEDAVHDAFLFLARNINRVEGTEGPKVEAYLRGIVKCKAIDIYHQESRPLPLDAIEVEEKSVDFYQNLNVEQVLNAIDKLPEQYQVILELVIYHNLSIRQIAALLGIRYDNAQKRLKRARTALLQQLRRN